MTRVLPGVYASIYDLSVLPEGDSNLTAGFVLRANRGPVDEAGLVTNSANFLSKYTFKGYPTTKDDPTFWTILRTLSQTNQVYVSRVSKGALYGGIVVRREFNMGKIVSITAETKTVVYTKSDVTETLAADDIIRIYGTGIVNADGTKSLDGRYAVKTAVVSESTVTVTLADVSEIIADFTATQDSGAYVYKVLAPVALDKIQLGDNVSAFAKAPTNTVTVAGSDVECFREGDRIRIEGSTNNNGYFTVKTAEQSSTNVVVTVNEDIVEETVSGAAIKVYRDSIANPEAFKFGDKDLFLITGIDQGAYNSDIAISIISTVESPDIIGEDPTTGAFQISVSDASSGVELEQPWLVSRIDGAKALDGTGLYIEEVINEGSAYIRVKNNEDLAETQTPCDLATADGRLGGGYDGVKVGSADYGRALKIFEDKTISVSVLGNGECEETGFQTRLVEVADNRLDCIAFINSRYIDETATNPAERANKIVKYKKELGTKWCATMYTPHVYVNDVFNSRQVKIGADGVAIPGWLKVIRESGYPYAFAGPSDGLVTGVTCKWKIGDMSGEAETLNDASINYIAYDAKVGRYYMQCQNTLQVANSALRNVGTVFNILNIKETFVTYFKEYLQKPITNSLRKQILDQGRNYMQTVMDANRVTNFTFTDTTTDVDLSNNTLRYLLVIAPTPYAQKIYLKMNIVNQTYDFSITQGGQV